MSAPGNSIRLPAPAKLNLFLHIIGRRDDGYHELQTLFQFIDFCDELMFEATDDGRIDLATTLEGVKTEDNLIMRAAEAIDAHRSNNHGVIISLRKRIPMGAGLGGGSSNAATTLLALNRLWQCGLDPISLQRLALPLGADVPVFINGRAAWAEGIGEQLQAVEPEECWYLVVYPGIAINTAAIFSHPDLTRNSTAITIPAFFRHGGHNDCEPVARQLHPEINRVFEWMENRTNARMTGTGSCVFGRFKTAEQARKARLGLPESWQGFVARGMNRSPAHLALKL